VLEVEGVGDRGKVGVAEGKPQPPLPRGQSGHVPSEIGECVDQFCLQQVHGQRVGGEVYERDGRLQATRLDYDLEELVDRVVDQHRTGQLGVC
jgi:hypothetical protein